MLFNIETDAGDRLTGYLVPDSFEEVPEIALYADGRLRWQGAATVAHPALVDAGRHRTGLCGFAIGGDEVPDLADFGDAEIRCAETGLVIYRRGAGRARVDRRLFRLETGTLPMRRFDGLMGRLFQAHYAGIERFGAETVSQLFMLNAQPSLYISGRIAVVPHARLLEGGIDLAVQLADPYEDLADRIWVLSGAGGRLTQYLDRREVAALAPALEVVDGIDPRRPRAIRDVFRRLDPDAALALSNPLTRQMACSDPSAEAGGGAVSAALRALAGFSVVAIREAVGAFEDAVADRLGLEGLLPARDPEPPLRGRLADQLAGIDTVEALLEADLEIYASVSNVFEDVAGDSPVPCGAKAAP